MPVKDQTLAEIVHHRASTDGDRIAYTFLADGAGDARSITWAQLDRRAATLASHLSEVRAKAQPILLALGSGLAFVESLIACWYAGAIAVPVSLPRHQRVKHRLDRIVADAGARFAIGTTETRQRLAGDRADIPLQWIDAAAAGEALPMFASPSGEDIAVLQYTSGSTGQPRGVVVTHANLMANSALIAEACGHDANKTIGGWLPLFHDMGLVGLVLQAAYTGARCVFMSPERFLMRPRLWLAMIGAYGICSSPAPNFAYDLCVDRIDAAQRNGLDLSGWRNALDGSEPVRAATLDRFAGAFADCGFNRRAFFPCYGLAEATLFVTGPGEVRPPSRRTAAGMPLAVDDPSGHVGCGRAFGDTQIVIVDPQTRRRVADGAIGEIWVAGESCAPGYWNNPDATAATFGARLKEDQFSPSPGTPGEGRGEGDFERKTVLENQNRPHPNPLAGSRPIRSLLPEYRQRGQDDRAHSIPWLRTGDLGFLANGELFITGRLRELIIIAGRNLFPVDLQRTVEAADPAVAPSGTIAFSIDINGVEQLIIAAELRRLERGRASADILIEFDGEALRRRLRAAVSAEHEVAVHDLVLVRPGSLPRTTSGKISQTFAREGYLNRTLEQVPSIHERAAT